MKKIILGVATTVLIFCMALCLFACNGNGVTSTDGGEVTEVQQPSTGDIKATDTTEMFTDKDISGEYTESEASVITLNGDGASCSGGGVTVSGGVVTITQKGVYIVTGTLTNGQVAVNVDDTKKVQLVLRNASINSADSAAIYVISADKVFLTLEGSNTVSNSLTFVSTDENIDGAIYSKEDLTVNGSGTLNVTCASGHGIVCKDDLKLMSGAVNVTSNAGHAVDANDSVRIYGGKYSFTSAKDGIHVENSSDATLGYIYIKSGETTIVSGSDGMDAGSTVQIDGGTFSLTNGGGSSIGLNTSVDSFKGIKANGNIVLNGGTYVIASRDDALHTNASIRIEEGDYTLNSGDDGIHADSVVLINGGNIDIIKSYEGIEGKSITVTGGTIDLVASDDGMNAAGGNDGSSIGGRPGQNNFATDGSVYITVTGGDITINAAGDGIDSNGSLYVSGGTIVVQGPSDNGNGALDYDSSAQITGGTIIAIGSSGMAQNFSSATQGTILINLSSAQKAGTAIQIKDSDGNVIFSQTAAKAYQSVLFSSPNLAKGNSYTFECGTYSQKITLTNLIYGNSSSMGGGMGGRM